MLGSHRNNEENFVCVICFVRCLQHPFLIQFENDFQLSFGGILVGKLDHYNVMVLFFFLVIMFLKKASIPHLVLYTGEDYNRHWSHIISQNI